MTDDTLLPDQSQLAKFLDLCDVTHREKLGNENVNKQGAWSAVRDSVLCSALQ